MLVPMIAPGRANPVPPQIRTLSKERIMTEHDVLVGCYIDTWNETNPSRRHALAERVLLDGARYTDPMMSSAGPKGFAEMIGAFQAQMPGLMFERVGKIDATGAMLRFSWRLVDTTGRQLASGTDVGEYSIDNRFAG